MHAVYVCQCISRAVKVRPPVRVGNYGSLRLSEERGNELSPIRASCIDRVVSETFPSIKRTDVLCRIRFGAFLIT